MADTGKVESFPEMLRRVLGHRLEPGVATFPDNVASFPDMFAEDGVMEMPYAPPGIRQRLEGPAAVAAHLEIVSELIRLDSMTDVVTHETRDPEVLVVEYAGHGQGVATGDRYEQRYISVIRTRDGKIAHYMDYNNPLAALRTIKGDEVVDALAVN